MKLHTLKPANGSTHSCKRIGRGPGSGMGGTSTPWSQGCQAAFRLQQEDWFRRWPDAFAASLAEVRLQEYQSC